MNHIKEFVEVLQDINSIEEQIKPLNNELNEKRAFLQKLNDDLSVNPFVHDFLCRKLIENFTEEQLLDISKHREYIKQNCEGPSVYYDSYLDKVFDPQYDDWYVYGYEKNTEGQIRFAVSCKKNEGSISGLLTFLDTHYTNWFYIDEFKIDI